MTYALTALVFVSLALGAAVAAAAATLTHVNRSLRGLNIALTSDF